MKFIFIYSADGVGHTGTITPGPFTNQLTQMETGIKNCLLLVSETDSDFFIRDNDLLGTIQGYVRYPNLTDAKDAGTHNRKLFRQILDDEFPLDEDVASSFASFALDPNKMQAAVANDVLGFYPIYYCIKGSELIISSHLLLISQMRNCEIDHTGVAQRLTSPEFCNFGARTILKDVFRLLPGEHIKFDLKNDHQKLVKYDNSLYSGAFSTTLRQSAEKLWQVIKEESEQCFKYDQEIAIGQSGGMDSRILLASLAKGKSVSCYTYGHESDYETRIAKRCSETIGAQFRSFDTTLFFPDREKLRSYVLETEAVGVNQWLSILENVNTDPNGKIPMGLGEMTEAIAGRNIKSYSSRSSRTKVFLGLKKIRWTPLDNEAFALWKKRKTASILKKIPNEDLPGDFNYGTIIAESEKDLEVLYKRIEVHDVKFVELLDELFAWYVHGRLPSSNQLLLLRGKFHPVCPTMSARCLREVSTIHPSLRLNSYLMDELFRLPELKEFARIPTAQIPFIGYKSNNRVKLIVWGIRSTIDKVMTKTATWRKKPAARNRLLKSTNLPLAYSETDPKIVDSWFLPDIVGGKRFIKIFNDRASQKAHPLVPVDIVSAAGVNMEIEFVCEARKSLNNKSSLNSM